MSKITKKFIAAFTALTCSVMMLGAGAMPVGATTAEDLQAQIDQLLSDIAALQAQLGDTTPTPPAASGTIEGCEITSFDRNLKVGMTGDDVKCMQIVLNSDTVTTLGSTGAGSPGNETSYFGPKTKAGVIKFQELYSDDVLACYNLTKGTGFVGPTTRAQLNVLLSATPAPAKTCAEITNAVECVTAECSWDAATKICSGEGVEPEPEKTCSEITEGVECVTAGCSWDAATTTCSSAVVPTPAGCTCTDWENDVCGGGDCVSTKMQQTRTCTADDGAEAGVCDSVATTQCVVDASCATTAGTGLTVALATDTAVAAAIASGTAYNKFLRVNLTAGSDGDVEVTGIKVTKGGISQNTAVVGIGVFDQDGNRHGNMVSSFTADNTASVTFASNPITVSAGTTVPVDIKINLTTAAAAQSGTIYMKIAAAADITTTAEVSGTFPLAGNTMSLVNGTETVGSVRVDAYTHTSGANQGVDIGTVDQIISKFTVAERNSKEDVEMVEITVYNNGNMADADLANLDLVDQNGVVLATTDATVGKYATFTLAEAYAIPKGTSRVFTIRADVVDGSTRTGQFIVQNDYDVVVNGVSSLAGILPVTTGNTVDTDGFPIGSANNLNTIIVNAGTLTVARNTGTASGIVTAGSSSQSLLKVDLTANGEDYELRQLQMTVTNGGSTALSGTVTIKTTDGTTVYSESASTYASGTPRTITLSSYLTIPASTTVTLEVTGSISSSATSSDSYLVSLTNWYGLRSTSNTFLGPTASAITGNTLTVGTGGLSVSQNQAFASTNVVAGQSDVKIGSFVFQATSNEDVNITSITLDGTTNTSITLANGYSNLKLKKEDGTNLGVTIPSPTATDVFSVSNFTVTSGVSEVVEVYVTISSSGTDTDTISAAVSAITAIGTTSQSSVSASGLTCAGQTMTVGLGGALTIALDSTGTAPASLLHAGELAASVLTVKFTANNFEDITVNDVTITIQNGDANVSKASLYNSSGTLLAGPVSIVNGKASFSNVSQLVKKNKTVSTYVKVDTTASGTMKSALATKAGVNYVKATGAGGLITYPYVSGSEGIVTALGTTGLSNTYVKGDVAMFKDNNINGSIHTVGMITTAGSDTTATYQADGVADATKKTATTDDYLLSLPIVSTETATNATGVKYSYAIGDPVIFYDAATASGTVYLGIVSATTPKIYISASAADTAIANNDQISKLPSTQTETLTAASVSNSYGIGDIVVYYVASTSVDLAMYTASNNFIKLGTGTTAYTLTATDIITTLPKVHSETIGATADKYYYKGDPVVIYDATTGVYLGSCTTSGYANVGGAAKFKWEGNTGAGTAEVLASTDIVTKLEGFGAVGNTMRMYDVEPTISLAASSPSGPSTPQANQIVAQFEFAADGDVDLEMTQIRLTKSGSNEPYRYVTDYNLYLGGTQIARVNQGTIFGQVDDTNGLSNTDWILDPNAQSSTADTLYVVANTEFYGFKAGDDVYIEACSDSAMTTNCTAESATISSTEPTDTAMIFTSAPTAIAASYYVRVTNKNVSFDTSTNYGTSGKALATQTITSGNTVTYTVKADTNNVKTNVTTQSVTFGVYLDGTAGSTGDLTWRFDPINGTADTSGGTYSDSYAIYSNTLTY